VLTRILSGLVMASGIVGILVYTPPVGLLAVVVFALVVAAREWQVMTHPEADRLDYGILMLALAPTALQPALQMWLAPAWDHATALTAGFTVLALGRLFRPDPIETSIRRLSADTLGFLYIGLTFPLIFLLRGTTPDGGFKILMVMAITFGADTGAYFAGRFLGRHKLYEKISPKKTIEGAVGGVVVGVVAVVIARTWFPGLGILSTVDVVVLGAGGAIAGMLGDLFESMVKRAYGVKDSGTLIPGHGGVLDRIDALLFVGPFAWFYMKHFVALEPVVR
jgi:phosphatidate cytidylyltransferase